MSARIAAGSLLVCLAGSTACTSREAAGPPELGPAVAVINDSATYDSRDVRAGARGDWWVLSQRAPFVRHYDAQGALLVEYGRRGRGPTDMIRPWQFLGDARGEEAPLLWDVGRKQVLSIDSTGRAKAVAPLVGALGAVRNDIETVTFGTPFQARLLGTRVIVALHPGDVSHTSDMARPVILSRMLDSEVVDTVVVPNIPAAPDETTSAHSLVAIPLWDMCSDTTIVLFDVGRNSIHRMTARGDTTATHVLDNDVVRRRPMTGADVEKYIRHTLTLELIEFQRDTSNIAALTKEIARRNRKELPEFQPSFVRLLCGANGDVWLQRFSLDDHPLGYSRSWVTVAKNNTVAEFRLPRGFAPIRIGEMEIIGTAEDADGAQWPSRIVIKR